MTFGRCSFPEAVLGSGNAVFPRVPELVGGTAAVKVLGGWFRVCDAIGNWMGTRMSNLKTFVRYASSALPTKVRLGAWILACFGLVSVVRGQSVTIVTTNNPALERRDSPILKAVVSGLSNVIYQWQFSPTNSSGPFLDLNAYTNATAYFPNVTTNRSGYYRVKVFGNTVRSGNTNLISGSTNLVVIPRPGNDDFADSFSYSLMPTSTGTQLIQLAGSTTNATREIAEPTPNGADGPSVWYRLVAITNGTLLISPQGSGGYAASIAVFSGTNLSTLGNPIQTQTSSSPKPISFQVTQGVVYDVQVSGFGTNAGGSGSYILNLRFSPDLPPPVIISQPSSNTVTLAGTGTPSLRVIADKVRPLAFQWFFNDQPIQDAALERLDLKNLTTADSGYYTVRVSYVSDSNNFVFSTRAYVSVVLNRPPSIGIPNASPSYLENSGPIVYPHFATIGPPGLDGIQYSPLVLTTVVDSGSEGLFLVPPKIYPDGTLTFTPYPNSNGVAYVNLFAKNDGGTFGGGVDTSVSPFTISVSPVNQPPGFDYLSTNIVILENAPFTTIAHWATNISTGPPNESTQNIIAFTRTQVVNSGLFSALPRISPSSGSLSFQPARNMVGFSDVTFIAKDDGGTSSGGLDTSPPKTFRITVLPVTQPPSFILPEPGLSVNENSGFQAITNWVTNISPGPPNQAGLTVGFLATTLVGSNLFEVLPTVSTNGTLTFVPATNSFGTATVSLVLTNNGSLENGGQNTSDSQTFDIVIQPVNQPPFFSLSGTNVTVPSNGGSVVIAGWATNIVAGPPTESDQAVAFRVSVDSGADLFATAPQINGKGDLSFFPRSDAAGVAYLTAIAIDNGNALLGGPATSAPVNFSITIGAPNLPPRFSLSQTSIAVLENSGPTNIAGWVRDIVPGTPGQSGLFVTFLTVTNSNPGLFAVPPTVSSDGTLSFTPAADGYGFAQIGIRATNNASSALGGTNASGIQSFRINVYHVNQPPSFSLAKTSLVVKENSGPVALSNAVMNVISGPASGGPLEVTFKVASNSYPALFAFGPSISPEGTLSFIPASNMSGVAQIAFVAQNDGGTAHGGQDTSDPQILTIQVTSINQPPTFGFASTNLTVPQTAGAVTNLNWVTRIQAGPSNETNQHVSLFLKSISNPELFSVYPAVSSDGTLTFTLSGTNTGTSVVSVYAMDDGGTLDGGVDTSLPQSFSITVLPVNRPPTFDLISTNISVFENFGITIAPNWATNLVGNPGGGGGVAHFITVSNSFPDLFLVLPQISTNGTLSFGTAPNRYGSAQIAVVAQNDGGSENGGTNTSGPQTFQITVLPINHPPSFALVTNALEVLDTSGLITNASWVTAISPGRSNELSQTVSLIISSVSNPSLFSVLPSIAQDGSLVFAPAVGAHGVALVSVFALDDGGTANGGVDRSPAQILAISVNHLSGPPSFTISSTNISVLENSGPFSQPGFLTNIVTEIEDTGALSVGFLVLTNSNTNLFLAPPSISGEGTLTFIPASNASGTALISFVGRDNGGTEDNRTDTSPVATFLVTVLPVNQAPSFLLSSNLYTVAENSGSISVTGWATNISSGPANESGQSYSFQIVTNSAPGLFSTLPAVSTNGTLTFTGAPNAVGAASVTLVLVDDGGTANGGHDTSAPQIFTIAFTALNQPPSFSLVATNVSVLENSGPVTNVAWVTNVLAGPPAESGQKVSILVVTNSNPGIFADPPRISADGVLTFTPALNASGVADIWIVAKDDGGGTDTSAAQKFVVTILPVNQPPSFKLAGLQVSALENSPASTVTGWVTNVSAGPANESGQKVVFLVTGLSNPGLFAVPPAISDVGDLTFTPALNQFGSAIIAVVGKDDGGTQNGGVDTSRAQTFTVTITPVNQPPSFRLAGTNVVTIENTGLITKIGWVTNVVAGPANEVSQAVNLVVVTNSNPALFALGPSILPNGDLVFTPATNASGTAVVGVMAHDNGGTLNGGRDTSDPQWFTIVVLPLNQAPSFSLRGTVTTAPENAGAVIVTDWVTNIIAGPPNESGQMVTFLVLSNSNPSLFFIQPAISGLGVLTFTGATNRSGSAEISVVAKDNGGTANGGIDTSSVQKFTIQLIAPNHPPTLSSIGDVTIAQDTVGSVSVSISDAETAVNDLKVTATSSDPLLISPTGIKVSATGAVRQISLAPISGKTGAAVISVTVTDAGGLSATRSFNLFVATTLHPAPTVKIASPVNGALYPAGNPVRVVVNAAATKTTISAVELFNGTNLVGTLSAAPYIFTLSNLPEGFHSLSARVIDALQGQSVSAPVLVRVATLVQSVAIVRKSDSPEIAEISRYLSETGRGVQVFDSQSVTPNLLQGYPLVIWDDLGDATALTDGVVDTLAQLAARQVPLYLIGSQLVGARSNLRSTNVSRWNGLIHLSSSPGKVSGSTVQIAPGGSSSASRPTSFVDDFSYPGTVESVVANAAEVDILGSVGQSTVLVSYPRPATADPNSSFRSVTQDFLPTLGTEAASISERKQLFQNTVCWLLRCDACQNFVLNLGADTSVAGSVGSEIPINVRVGYQGNPDCPITGVRVEAILPDGLTFVSGTAEHGYVDSIGSAATVVFGQLQKSTIFNGTLVVMATNIGTYQFAATVYADEFPANQSPASVGITVVVSDPSLSPSLQLINTGTALDISWSDASASYKLESTTSLVGTPSWTSVGIVPVQSGGRYHVQVPITGAVGFYRLHAP